MVDSLARSVQRTFTLRSTSPEQFVADYRRWYGPTLKAFEALGEDGRAALAADLAGLARRWDRKAAAASPSPPPTWKPSSPSADRTGAGTALPGPHSAHRPA